VSLHAIQHRTFLNRKALSTIYLKVRGIETDDNYLKVKGDMEEKRSRTNLYMHVPAQALTSSLTHEDNLRKVKCIRK